MYYGLVFSTDEFTGDRYLNFTLFALADLAGVLIAVAVINAVQRRLIICGCYGVIIAVAGAILIIDFVLDRSNDNSVSDFPKDCCCCCPLLFRFFVFGFFSAHF